MPKTVYPDSLKIDDDNDECVPVDCMCFVRSDKWRYDLDVKKTNEAICVYNSSNPNDQMTFERFQEMFFRIHVEKSNVMINGLKYTATNFHGKLQLVCYE